MYINMGVNNHKFITQKIEYKPSCDINVINFGLNDDDLNYKLMKYIDNDVLTRLPLKDFQIDILADRLNWDILSSKELAGWIFVKYKDRIDWSSFLKNGHPKEINYLLDVKDKLQENANVFLYSYVKKMYYTPIFISAMPEFVDWKWCAKNIQLSDYILLRNWNKMNVNIISKYQKMSEYVIRKKKNYINWIYAGKHKMTETLMEDIRFNLSWNIICKHQKLSPEFIDKLIDSCSKYHISKYQDLPEWFILKHKKWLNLKIISQYQNMSINFIRNNLSLFNMEMLKINKNYNQIDTIQIFHNQTRWYIIDASIIETKKPDSVIFCNIEPNDIFM